MGKARQRYDDKSRKAAIRQSRFIKFHGSYEELIEKLTFHGGDEELIDEVEKRAYNMKIADETRKRASSLEYSEFLQI